mmetsp:Transcript_22693/g.42466  ORF Transcript_22693/g.42466 Transcript_22693/m.42466 type:complete len:353 (-) Transcript_22693:75-1133(-)
MASREQRAMDGVLGVFVADAASMGLHWIYDNEQLMKKLGTRREAPEFFSPPSCPFYSSEENPGHYEAGMSSPYGEEALALLDYMDAEGGEFADANAFAASLYNWSKNFKGYKNMCTKQFQANMDKLTEQGASEFFPACGSNDAQANLFFKIPLLVVKYGSDQDTLLDKVDQAVRCHQNKPEATEYACSFALMMLAAIDGASLEEAIEAGKEAGQLAAEGIEQAKIIAAVDEAGLEHGSALSSIIELSESLWEEGTPLLLKFLAAFSCSFPGSFIVGIKLLLESKLAAELDPSGDAFQATIRRNILLGGDSCGRLGLIAALLAATGNQVPADWCAQTQVVDRVMSSVDKMVDV